MTKSRCLCVWLLTATLAWAESLIIPRMKTAEIKVDGVVGKEEYACASLLEGMVHFKTHRLINRDVSVLVTSTEEALYMTMSNAVEETDVRGGFITAAQTGGRVWADDCVEFFVVSSDGSMGYQFIVNAANATVVFMREKDVKPKIQAVPFRSASQVHDGKWEVEVELPWASMPEINPLEFGVNVARNFVRANFGYANLTGTDMPTDPKKMIAVKALEGFPGVKVYGVDHTLIQGRFALRMEYEGGTLTGKVRERGSEDVLYVPGKVVELPDPKYPYKSLVFMVTDPKLGVVQLRGGVPFELGKTLTDGPVTNKWRLPGLGQCFLRYYPSYNKFTVMVDAPEEAVSGMAEVTAPDGNKYSAALARTSDDEWRAVVDIPAKRPLGEWVGKLIVKDAEGKETTVENAFSFTEKSFPFMQKKLGISNKILPPFEPIQMKGDKELTTIFRKHSLAQDGLLQQVNSKGVDILAKPLGFELVVNGKPLSEEGASLKVVKAEPHEVITKATARYGNWKYKATTTWEYDGFARVQVSFTPPADEVADRLTLCASLRQKEAFLFNSVVDLGRGNPAGAIPAGKGKVWDSSTLPRRMNDQGLPVVPGEFTPYVWFGGDERGLSLTFNSPRGFDLLDGMPMIRLLREEGAVKAECDIISRKGTPGKPVAFEFCFQVTPVKPRVPGWKKWVFQFGDRLPGMLHILPFEHDSVTGCWTRFAKVPPNGDYSYAKAFKETMEKRVPKFDIGKHFDEVDDKLLREYYTSHEGFMKQRFGRDIDGYVKTNRWRMLDMQLGQHAMTADRVVPYTCPSIIPFEDEAYQYHKAEWATVRQYWMGVADRCFFTERYIDYLLWSYEKLLDAGMDGIYLDELYVFPQTNPDLSTVRDYKNRVIPEMNILESRELVKRIAYLLDSKKKPEMLLIIHFTNTHIVPAFSFGTIGLDWEYHVETKMEDYVSLEHVRAHSTGLQAGLVPMALIMPKITPRPPAISNDEYLEKYRRISRTALGLMVQHEITTTNRIFGDYVEPWKLRYTLWAFGTHRDDCEFIPHYSQKKPFSVTDNSVVGGYRRGHSALLMVTNVGEECETLLKVDTQALGVAGDAVMMDITTGESFPLSGEQRLKIKECDFHLVFVGPQEFGETLVAPEPNKAFIK